MRLFVLMQGLDPKSTADLFSGATWAGEKRFNGANCFVLRVDAAPRALRARSRAGVEALRHTLLGYFSQRTGLLVGLEDTHAVRVDGARWETSMSSCIGDYRRVDGVHVAHAGGTCATLTRFGLRGNRRTRTRMEEAWIIQEVGFNVAGLCNDCFLPPPGMLPCDCEPHHAAAPPHKECLVDGTTAACEVAAPEVIRPAAAARKVLVVPAAAAGLACFGLVKVASVGTVDVVTQDSKTRPVT